MEFLRIFSLVLLQTSKSGVVVHGEFVGVRPLTQLLHFLVFQSDPVVDEVFCEDATGQQVLVVGLESFQ